eukprot:2909847-Pleurochrysis_carterae.AAC.1
MELANASGARWLATCDPNWLRPNCRQRTFLCRRATHRMPRVPEDTAPTTQAISAVSAMHLSWTRSQPTRTHVPRPIDEANLRLAACPVHRDFLFRTGNIKTVTASAVRNTAGA